MQIRSKLIIAAAVIATTTWAGVASAQTAATSVGRAASAAVTPGDQDMGRNPSNRSGGLMGNDATGTSASGTTRARPARADRG